MPTKKVFKRPCYYNHKLGRERHIWGEYKEQGKYKIRSRQCLRCKLRTQIDLGSLNLLFKAKYSKLAKNIYNENPLTARLYGNKRTGN